jgi:predicted DNA-binding protein (UPF0251 family)
MVRNKVANQAAHEQTARRDCRRVAGLTLDEAAAAMGIARRTANRYWTFARAWLYDALGPK